MPPAIFNVEDISSMEKRFRASFINSLGGFKSVTLVGTRDRKGNSNLAVFSSFFHIGANPPLFGLIFRPDTVERHTLQNIRETGVFTVNHVHADFYKEAHQCSAKYSAGMSEFTATGLEEGEYPGFHAPFVQQSRVKMGAALEEIQPLTINGTILIIASIQWVIVPEPCIGADGFVDLEKAGTITCSGLDSYHATRKLSRLSYAVPEKMPEDLKDFQ